MKEKWLLSYFRPYRSYLLGAIAILFIAKGLEAYIPIYIGEVTQVILNSVSLDESMKTILFSSVVNHSLMIIALIGFTYLFEMAVVVMKNWVGQKALYTLRTEVYDHIQQLPLRYYDTHAVGTLMTRTIHDVDQINLLFSESLVPLFGSLILFISICFGVAILDWRVALVLAVILPFVLVMTNTFRINQRRCYNKIRKIVAAMNAFVQEHLMGASTVRSFGLQEKERERFEQINQEHCQTNIETIRHFSFFFAGIDFVQSLSLIAVFVVLVAFSQTFQAGTYFTFSLYALMLFRPMADLAERYNVLQAAFAAAERISELLEQKGESGPMEGPSLDEIQSITFEDVWFAYKEEHWVLKGLSFSIEKGESLALVGITGAGKTTILNLLLRFYHHQRGTIKINGRDIEAYTLKTLRGQFNVVLQDPEIFSGTISENMSLFNPEITPEKIDEVTEYTNLKPLLTRFPDGVNHQLSERGKSLSVGERQLVSMARAVAHPGSVIILDEATANIDTGTEKVIQDALGKILRDKTAIVIAHRLSTIKDVQKILVLHDGRVVEMGSHEELLAEKGIYEKLYRLQFK